MDICIHTFDNGTCQKEKLYKKGFVSVETIEQDPGQNETRHCSAAQ